MGAELHPQREMAGHCILPSFQFVIYDSCDLASNTKAGIIRAWGGVQSKKFRVYGNVQSGHSPAVRPHDGEGWRAAT
jgi:hypothetical protein